MSMKSILLFLFFGAMLLVSAQESLLFHADASALKTWKTWNTRATIQLLGNSDAVHVRYSYDAAAANMHASWGLTHQLTLNAIPTSFAITMKGDKSSNLYAIKLLDQSGETFQYRIGTLTWDNMQTVTVQYRPDLKSSNSHWGGDKNGILNLPIKEVALEFRKFSQQNQGEVQIADFKIFGDAGQELSAAGQKWKTALLRRIRTSPDIAKPGMAGFDQSSPLLLDRRNCAGVDGRTGSGEISSARCFLNYDDRYFYLAAKVKDSLIHVSAVGNMIYMNDGLELYFDCRNDSGMQLDGEDDFQLVVNPAGGNHPPRHIVFRNNASAYLMAGIQVVSEPLPDGYLLKLRIPRKAMVGFEPEKQAAAFEIALCDNNGKSLTRLFWSGKPEHNFLPLQYGFLAAADAPESMTAGAVSQRKAAVERLTASAKDVKERYTGSPVLLGNRILTGSPEKYQKVEGEIDLKAEYRNPFDFEDLNVKVTVTAPDGKTIELDAFYFELYTEIMYGYKRSDRPGSWRWRFTPSVPGRHTFRTTLRDHRGRTAALPEQSFIVKDSNRRGFVRISPHDPHYLRFDNGEFFYGIGYANHLWNDKQVDYYYRLHLNQLAAFGGNYTSVNFEALTNCGFQLDAAGKMRYSMLNAARIDALLTQAEKRGIYIIPCLTQTHWGMSMHWKNNPFNAANGGPCKEPDELFTNPEVLRIMRNRHRYTVARYAYSPSLLYWELFNEIEYTAGFLNNPDQAFEYIRALAKYMHSIDPYGRLVATSGNMEMRVPGDSLFDTIVVHVYGRDITERLNERTHPLLHFNKPFLGGEIGMTYPQAAEGEILDPEGVAFHNSLYASLFCGAAGTILHWWPQYLEVIDRYEQLRCFGRFIEGLELDRLKPELRQLAAIRPADSPQTRVQELPLSREWPQEAHYPVFSVRNGTLWKTLKALDFKQELDGDSEAIAAAGAMNALLAGSSTPGTPREVTLTVTAEKPGKIRITPGAVARSGARLEIQLDGKTAVSRSLADRDQEENPYADEKFEDLLLALGKGTHTLTFHNSGKGFLAIKRIALEDIIETNTNSGIRVLALIGDGASCLWAQNLKSTWYYSSRKEPLEKFSGHTVALPVRSDGEYRVRPFLPWSGTFLPAENVRSEQGKITVTLPDFERDIAVRAEKIVEEK